MNPVYGKYLNEMKIVLLFQYVVSMYGDNVTSSCATSFYLIIVFPNKGILHNRFFKKKKKEKKK